jgi:hypothetical protein
MYPKKGSKVKPHVFLSLAPAKNNQLCPPASRTGPRDALEVMVKKKASHFIERLKCTWKYEFDCKSQLNLQVQVNIAVMGFT